MKYNIEYELVIPIYNDYDSLNILLGQLDTTNTGYKPGRIIIVNDGSTDERIEYAEGMLGGKNLPPIHVVNTSHQGPFNAETTGLAEVRSPYAVVFHSDIELIGAIPLPLIKDPVSALVCYLHQTTDAVAVSCFGLNSGIYDRIEMGPRGIWEDVPVSIYRTLVFYSIYQSKLLVWQRVLSSDSHCYALNMDVYAKLGGFNSVFSPYGFYHDDFFARARQILQKHVYYTTDTVVYHPGRKESINGSLATVHHKDRFVDMWGKGNPIWTDDSLRNNVRPMEVFQ